MLGRTVLLAMLSVAGCGTQEPADPTATCDAPGVGALGIDPLGRGDGLDITEGAYDGPCYQDEAMEAARPVPPDPRDVAIEKAEAIARASSAAAETARQLRDEARDAYEASFATQSTPADPDQSAAGIAFVTLVTVAAAAAEEAYQIGLVLLAPDEPTTWQDLIDHPEQLINDLVDVVADDLVVLFEQPFIVDLALEVLGEVLKAELLEFLEDARDAAQALLASVTGEMDGSPGADVIVANPQLQEAFEAAEAAYQAALAQSVADSNAALELLLNRDAPSELPPCDADELGETLKEALCTGEFVNPVTDEDEAELPGIRARIDAYVAEVCVAVACY